MNLNELYEYYLREKEKLWNIENKYGLFFLIKIKEKNENNFFILPNKLWIF